MIITSTCLFIAFVLRRKLLGKKDEGKEGTPSAAATGAGGIDGSSAAAAGGAAGWMRRHRKTTMAVVVVVALASGTMLVASQRTRAAVEGAAFVSSGGSLLSVSSSPAAGEPAVPAPTGALPFGADGGVEEEDTGSSSSTAAVHCRVEAVTGPCAAAAAHASQEQAQKEGKEEAGQEWGSALGQLLMATNATSVADLILLVPSFPQDKFGFALPPLPSDAEAYVGGFIGLDSNSDGGKSSEQGQDDGRAAYLPSIWRPVDCPTPPRWRRACGSNDEASGIDEAAFDLMVLRGMAGALQLPPAREGVKVLKAIVLADDARPSLLALAVPSSSEEAADDAACPDACGSGGAEELGAMRPQCPPWRLPPPRWRVPAADGGQFALAAYSVVDDLLPLVEQWPADEGLC